MFLGLRDQSFLLFNDFYESIVNVTALVFIIKEGLVLLWVLLESIIY